MKKLLYILIFCFASFVFGQENNFQQDVEKYLAMNGTTEQYQGAIDQLFSLLKQQYSNYTIEQVTWDELYKDASGELGRIRAMLVSAYRGTYEHEDIKNMIAFFETETGAQFLKDQTAMTSEQKQKAADFYNTATGQKILTSKNTISQRVTEVSEIWSRDLYRSMIDKLATKGYVMQQ